MNLNNLEIPKERKEVLFEQILKRSDERELFGKFLNLSTISGLSVYEEMENGVEMKVEKLIDEGVGMENSMLIDFVIGRLKENGVYKGMISEVIIGLDPAYRPLQKKIEKEGVGDLGKYKLGYPKLAKKAQGLVKAKIADGLNRMVLKEYLAEKEMNKTMRLFARELYFGVNKLDLDGDGLIKYLRVIFQLDQLSTATMVRDVKLKYLLGEAIKQDKKLVILNIKCLRFVYPEGKSLKLIDNMEDEVVKDRLGNPHKPKSEKHYFERLKGISDVFGAAGIDFKVVVLVADLDFDDYFPEGEVVLFPENDVEKAREKVGGYVVEVANKAGKNIEVTTLSEYLKEMGLNKKYKEIKQKMMVNLRNGGDQIGEKMVEERVNYRYESNMRIFGKLMTRDQARRRVCEQLSSLFALEVLNGDGSILVAEERGDENKLIGGENRDGLPVMFVKLRDGASNSTL